MNDLTIWCSLTGTWPETRELGEYYVHVLRDMVFRSLHVDGKLPRFVCLTEKPIEGIECVVEPDMPASWWNKMWLFKHGTTGRNLYLDLDTVIVNRMEPFIEALRGTKFTCLQDLAPGRVRELTTTGVFYWEGDHSDIYNDWIIREDRLSFGYGTPYDDSVRGGNVGGDSAWFAFKRPQPDPYPWIQDVVGDKAIRSYKFDGVMWEDWPPAGSVLICLHGYPRPHHVTDGWLPKVWCIGGFGVAAWRDILNVKQETMMAQIQENAKHPNVKILDGFVPAHDRTVLLCAGGPSLGDTANLQMISGMQKLGAKVWALNGAYGFLRDKGIVPDAMVILDGRMENVRFLEKLHGRTSYLLSLGCHPVLFERLKEYNVMGWYPIMGEGDELLQQYVKVQVGGGSTVGLRAIMLAWVFGYRNFKLFGYDSSYRRIIDGENIKSEGHAYKQDLNDGELDAVVHTTGGKSFHAARWMARQAEELRGLLAAMDELKDVYGDCKFEVFGDGLFPHLITDNSQTQAIEQGGTSDA